LLRILTNLLDVPAEIIAFNDYVRWAIEAFQRCFESWLQSLVGTL